MKHHFLDRFSHLNSPVHNLNTTVKLISTLIFLFTVVSFRKFTVEKFLFCLLILGILILLSRIPFLYFLKNLLILSPFIFLAGISLLFVHEGKPVVKFGSLAVYDIALSKFLDIVTRSLVSISLVQIFITTTRFDCLLETLRTLKIPAMILELFSFLYRYVFVLTDELMRSKMAASSRGRLNFMIWGHILRGAFVRSIERGRLVYLSMKARGFRGEFRTLRKSDIGVADLLFGVITIILVSVLWKL